MSGEEGRRNVVVGERKANEYEETRGKLDAPKNLKDWGNVK